MELFWETVTRRSTFADHALEHRDAITDALDAQDWERSLSLLSRRDGTVNATWLGDRNQSTPLHRFVLGGAGVGHVDTLVAVGALKSVRDAQGNRPVDLAFEAGRHDLVPLLQPQPKHVLRSDLVWQLEVHMREVIFSRVRDLVEEHELRLPQLDPMLELDEAGMWCPIPRMYGGFRFDLKRAGDDPIVMSSSASRIAGGSGQRHQITIRGYELVEEGYV